MIGIIDYGVGNIKAFANIYKNLNMAHCIVKKQQDLEGVTKIILPGVGSFDHAMISLNESGMRETLDELVLEKHIPVIGICVGMQMLAHRSEEGELSGLGWINGEVKKLDSNALTSHMPLPHMGWNRVHKKSDSALIQNLEDNAKFYFLHSYYFHCHENNNIIGTASYGDEFACIINNKNVYGIQCHPEKSHSNGINLLKNFGNL